ncbi:AAA family ATPase [Actinoplanes sp. NPDC000266]
MRYILTGTPGSGKTALLRHLETAGYAVVEEAATDVIALRQALGVAEPWQEPDFIDHIVALQRRRQLAAADRGITFFDRSPICTLALSRYAGLAPSPALRAEIERTGHLYERTVFFVRHQGFVQPTAARRISFEDSLVFERIHEETYRQAGFALVEVPAAPLETRIAVIRGSVHGR